MKVKRTGITDWLKLRLILWRLSGSDKAVRQAIKIIVGMPTGLAQNRALHRLASLNQPSEIDQVCEIWRDTRHPGLGKVIAQQGWVATGPLELRILSALQADKGTILPKDRVAVLGRLIWLCQEEADLVLARRAADCLEGMQSSLTREDLYIYAWWQQFDQPLFFDLVQCWHYLADYSFGFQVLVALKVGRPELLTQVGAEVAELLLQVYLNNDPNLTEQARLVLLHLEKPEAQEKLCQLAQKPYQPAAQKLVLEAGYYPREAHQRALFFFLTRQWEKYEDLDFNQNLLSFIYKTADAQLRLRITQLAREAGRAELATIIVGGQQSRKLHMLRQADWKLILELLVKGQRWSEMWELAQVAPPVWGVAFLQSLAEVNWRPTVPAEQMIFSQLTKLAVECKGTTFPLGQQLCHLATLIGHYKPINALAISPDGHLLATGGRDGTIRLWSLPEGQLIITLQKELILFNQPKYIEYSVQNLVFSPDGQRLAFVYAPHDIFISYSTLQLLRVADRKVERVLELGVGLLVWSGGLAFSPDGKILAASRGSEIWVWNPSNGELLNRWDLPSDLLNRWSVHSRTTKVLVFSPDGQWLAVGCSEGSIMVWNVSTGLLFRDIKIAKSEINSLVFSPDGSKLVIGSKLSHLLCWNIIETEDWYTAENGSKQELCVRPEYLSFTEALANNNHNIETLAFSPDGQRLAFGLDQNINLWNIDINDPDYVKGTGNIPFYFPGTIDAARKHTGVVTGLAFTPDGQYLISVGRDCQVIIWSLRLFRQAHVPVDQTKIEDLFLVRQAQRDPDRPISERDWLAFSEALLGWRFQYEIEIDEAPAVKAGDFDIEIEG